MHKLYFLTQCCYCPIDLIIIYKSGLVKNHGEKKLYCGHSPAMFSKELSFCHNFLVSIFLHPWYLKLRLFDLTEYIVWNS